MKANQSAFAGGVLSKGLWGRTDLSKYQTGVKRASNFIVAVEGGLYKRNGFYYTGLRKYQTANMPARLIPWRISNADSYMLEFGHEYIRFIRLGGYVTIPDGFVHAADNIATNVDGYMEVATSYAAEDVASIKYTLANDIIYLNHPDYPEYQLQRLGLYDWNLVPSDFDPHPAWTGNGSVTWHNDIITADNYVPVPVRTEYKISATMADGTETKPSDVIWANGETGHQRCWFSLDWDDVAGATQYTIYKGKNGIFGFIGYTQAGTTYYEDRNIAPSYDTVPLDRTITFPSGNSPGVSEFYKQRRIYAGFNSASQKLIGSRPLLFNSLYTSVPSKADDAIDITLVGRERHNINHMIELKKFIIFTDTAEWLLGTEQGAALSAASIDPSIETHYGAHPLLRPIPIGDRILFIQNITGDILDMGYEYVSDAFKADNLSRLARDLFKNKDISSWTSAVYPYNILPCSMSDGTANILTYSREHEIWAWTSWETQGEIIELASVTEITEDALYAQVKRKINGVDTYFIERYQANYNDLIKDMLFVDCALSYSAYKSFSNFTVISATEATVVITSHGYSVTDELQLENAEGTSECRVKVIEIIDTDTVKVSPVWSLEFPDDCPEEGKSYKCFTTVTNLGHLEGMNVWVLADGKVYKNFTVASGEITIAAPVARVHVGLPYEAEIVTLDMDAQSMRGGYIFKSVGDITLMLSNSRGVYVGPSEETDFPLQPILPRSTENMYDANSQLDGAYILSSHVAWSRTGGVKIKSQDPLPCNVLAIVPDVYYGS